MSKRYMKAVDVQKVIPLMPAKMQAEILEIDTELKRLRNERRTK